jgi:hypothetical protein
MATEKPLRDPFLAAMEAKVAAWTAAIESYRKAASLDGPVDVSGGAPSDVSMLGSPRAQGYDLPVGVFRDKSLKEAIPIYLAAGRRKQTNKEIAVGLKVGGFPTTAENFEATVATALFRLKKEGTILRFPDGWDMASSYPDGLRSRLAKDAKPRKSGNAKATQRQRKGQAGAVARPIAHPKPQRIVADGPTLSQEILGVLVSEGPSPLDGLSTRLAKPNLVMRLALGKLTKAGKVEKLASGNYVAAKPEQALRAV